MNILEALVKLRDDLKLWTTNNLQALKNEIDNKSEFSGDYQDLANKPDIDGKIKTAVDPLTTSIGSLQEKDIEVQDDIDELNNNIGELTNTVDTHTANEEIHTTQEEKDTWNEHTENADIHVTAESKLRWDNKSDFSGSYNDLLDAPDIVDDNTGVLKFVDNNKNIIMQVGADGLHTTSIILDDEVTANKATLDSLDVDTIKLNGNDLATMMDTKVNSKFEELVDSAPDSLDTLNKLAAALGDDPNFSVTVLGKIAAKADASELGKYALKTDVPTVTNDLTNELMTNYNNAYNHSQSEHAPVDAQKNSDITKAEIEAKLTGDISTHNHNGMYYTETEVDNLLSGKANSSHGTHVTWATNAPKANGTAAVGTVNRVAREDHVHPLQTTVSGNAGSANKVNNNLVIKINGGTTEGTNMFTFNGSAGKTIDIKASALGAPASHTHDDRYYTETEIDTKLGEVQDNIQAAVDGYEGAIEGAKTELQTAINNEATSRTNADNALDARLDVLEGSGAGSVAKALADAKSYADTKVAGILDSAPETLNTLNELAAALGDDPNFATTIANQIGGKADKSHGNHVPATQTANNAVFLRNDNTWQTVTPANIGAAAASHGTHVTYDDTNKPKAAGTAACGTSGKVARADHVHPVQTSVSGNAGSANKVNNALSIQLNGGTATSFDGSAAKSINITPASIGAAADHNHNAYVNQNAFSKIAIGNTNIVADVAEDTLTLVAGSNVTISPDATNDKITISATDTVYTHPSYTARISGLYKITVDGTGHISSVSDVAKSDITALGIPAQDTVYTHPNSGATAGSYGPSANATPGYGATFNVPYLTVNAAGHVTAISTKTVKIPASDNTWRGVQDNLTSTSTTDSLSANQGKILKDLVDTKADMIEETELETMLSEVFSSGNIE